MAIVKRGSDSSGGASSLASDVETLPPAPVKNGVTPACKFVNVHLCGMTCQEGRTGSNQATVLLENPQGQFALSSDLLKQQVSHIFSLRFVLCSVTVLIYPLV